MGLKPRVQYADFEKIDFRVGKIINVEDFPESKSLSYKLTIDFGKEVGFKKSCARATNYPKKQLLGMQVICVINFPPKQIANAISEVLVLGVETNSQGTAILKPDFEAKIGAKVF